MTPLIGASTGGQAPISPAPFSRTCGRALAGERCIEIFRSEHDLQRRQTAVGILCLVVANNQLYIVEELLNDPDPTIQEYGAAILENLVDSRLRADPNPEPFIALAENHSNEQVREKAATIRREWVEWP